jgi:tripartite tricarboxylate transporter TctB family protein
MTLRTDHIAGAFFILFAVGVLSVSGDLPIGHLSMPGSGMMPTLACGLIILFGALLILRGGDSEPLATLRWNDLPHAGRVIVIAAAAVVGYATLGFVLTMALMLFALIALAERRNPIYAALYSIGVVALTYFLFAVVLKTPLETGILGF